MAALGSQSIASSYEQLLHVDRDGGGNTTNHVSVKDGDNGTTFALTLATDAVMITSDNRLEFGDDGTYIHQSANGVLDLVSDTEIELNGAIDINGAVTMDGGNVTINDDSGDYDFRVESNGNANMLFVDGGADAVGIGTATPTTQVSATTYLEVSAASGTAAIGLNYNTGSSRWEIESDSGDDLTMSRNGTSRLLIDGSTADISVQGGDIIFTTAGKGICLGVTSNTDSNTLDDYEEGTWSPVITDGTNNATMRSGFDKGAYTKIGNLVHVQGDVEITSLGSVSGDIEISGLPFAATSASDRIGFSAGTVVMNQGSITAGHSVVGQIVHGTSVIKLKVYDVSTGISAMQGSEWSGDGNASFAITYIAA